MVAEENISCDDFADFRLLLSEAVEHIKIKMKTPNGVDGISTGFRDFDRFCLGLQRGDLIALAGRPGMGEGILALNIAEHVAFTGGMPVAILDMDRGMMSLAMHLLASSAKINYNDLRQGSIDDGQAERLSHAADKLKDAPIHISTTTAVSVQEVGDRLRKLNQKTGGLGLAIVDCLPELKLTVEMVCKNTVHEIAMTSRYLKALAMELDVPMIVLSPINRDLEERVNKRPQLVDLPCGAAIASAADLVLFVYRDSVYDSESADQGMAEMIVAKNTNGSVGSFLLKYNEKYPRFEDVRPG